MFRFLCAVAATVVSLTPAFAARYVWTGAASGSFSNAANWTGGSPAGDPEAELSFPGSVARIALSNDIAGLTVRSIAFSSPDYTIGGNAITVAAAGTITDSSYGPSKINTNLILSGGVTFVSTGGVYSSPGIIVDGVISGSGPITKVGNGLLTFAGSAANTYSGETHVNCGELRLWKPGFVTAVPGNLFLGRGAIYDPPGEVVVMTSEQIADSAAISVGPGSGLYIGELETLGPITIADAARIRTSATRSGVISSTGKVILGGDITIVDPSGNGSEFWGEFILPATRTIDIPETTCCPYSVEFWSLAGGAPDAGVIVRGAAAQKIDLKGTWTGPTTIDGPFVIVDNPATAVTLRNGRVAGSMKSLTAHSGTVQAVTTAGDLRLGAGAAFVASTWPSRMQSGVVRLGATIDPDLDVSIAQGVTYVVLQNDGTLPIVGTFANAPAEGSIVEGFRISYVGGDGNDVTLTDTRKLYSRTDLTLEASAYEPGQTIAVTASVVKGSGYGDGQVTFFNGNSPLATATLDALGRATTSFTPSTTGTYTITARYHGTTATEPSEASKSFEIRLPRPTLTSVTPTSVTAGETVTVIAIGTNFTEDAYLVVGSTILPTTWVSATEVRATWTVPKWEFDVLSKVYVNVPAYVTPELSISVTGIPPTASPFTWETSAVSGPVAPGAQSVWLRGLRRYENYITWVETEYGAVADSDNDGVVRWAMAKPIPLYAKFLMVDVQTGALVTGEPDDKVHHPMAQGATFLRGTDGAISNIMFTDGLHHAMWVRPGVGAWRLFGTRPGSPVTTSTATPLYGTTPPPAGIEPGDVFVAIYNRYDNWYGGVVDAHIGHGPGILGLVGSAYVREDAGVATLTVIRTGGADGSVSVNYTTVDQTATAGVAYQAQAGTLTFAEGEVKKTITIPLIDDAVYGGRLPSFNVRLTDPVDATVGAYPEVPVQIQENDPTPALAVGPDISMDEGDGETKNVTFTVTLTGATRLPVRAYWWYRTNDPYSYSTYGGQLDFAPGETQKSITYSFKGNTLVGPDRVLSFYVSTEISDDVTIAGEARLTILDDDDYASISIADATVNESAGIARITVELSKYSARPVTVSWGTESVTAFSGRDYTRMRSTVTLQGRAVIEVPILNDTLSEGDESFLIVLSNPVSGRIDRAAATVVITDDDQGVLPTLNVEPVAVQERSDAAVRATFSFRLSEPSTQSVMFNVRTINGTAIGGSDFSPASSYPIIIYPGQLSAIYEVWITDDITVEPAETFTVEAFDVVNATLGKAQATGTIYDNDGSIPTVSIDGVKVFEGDGGLTPARFVLRLTQTSANPVTVNWQTAPGTAATSDFQSASGQIVFAAGETTKTVVVNVVGDTSIESDETFTLKINSATGATVGRTSATATIVNDDHPPKPPH